MLIIGNLDADGYLEDAARGPGRGGRRSRVELAEAVLKRIQEFDPVGVGARTSRSAC